MWELLMKSNVSCTILSQVCLLGMLILPAAAAERNWPTWRGPQQDGYAPDSNPPSEWSETKNVKWKIPLEGQGDSTPIVWGNRIFLLSVVQAPRPAATSAGGGDQYQWIVSCLDRTSGKSIWRKIAHEGPPLDGPNEGQHMTFASYSPATDGQRIYVSFGSAGLYCYDFDGNLQWTGSLQPPNSKRHGGEGGSLSLDAGKLVIVWDHPPDGYITALDPATGKPIWKTDRNQKDSWFTPLIVGQGPNAQVITTGESRIRSYDLATGRQIWESEGLGGYAIPTAVGADGMVFAMTGFGGENKLVAIRLGRSGDLTGTDAIVWHYDKRTSYIASPALINNLLFFIDNKNNRISCVDVKTGKALIDAATLDDLGEVYASPVCAGDRVYVVGRNGYTAVIQAGAPLKVRAVNQLDDQFDASPAVVGNELLLRGRKYLYCVSE